MNAPKLTARQIETIRHVHDFMSRNGLPPSIGELKRALGVASDQAVIEILQRLEARGMIERTAGQARGLRLTAEACLAIGVQPVQAPAGSSGLAQAGARQFEMNPQQQRIHERLADIDPKLARMYEGGLRVLLDETNPERIAMSAHAIRESTSHLSNMGKGLLSKEEEKAAKVQRGNNALQLEKLFDPLGGVGDFGPNVYDTWSREFHQFFVEVSHHGCEPTPDEYRERLSRFENFLFRYVLPLQVEIYAHLDQQLASGPEKANEDELRMLLSRNVESFRYFYRKADARWLTYLELHKFLNPRWEVADYLARIAGTASGPVMEAIEKIDTTDSDWFTRKGLIDAAVKMPSATARRLVDKIEQEKWLAETYQEWLTYPLDDLIGVFIAASNYTDALRLIALLLQGQDGHLILQSHHLEKILKNVSAVPAPELPAYITLLVQTLAKAVAHDGPDRNDLSVMWRPAIEDHEQNWRHHDPKDRLITSLRDSLCRHVEHRISMGDPEPWRALDDLLSTEPQYSMFIRLNLHVYRLFSASFMPQIEVAIVEHFDLSNAWHEYYLLIASIFPRLSEGTQARYFELVDRGPKGDHDEAYIPHWKARKLAPILAHLSHGDMMRYQALAVKAQSMAHPDLLSYHTSSWGGLSAPISATDLAALPVDKLLELLASWTPPKDFFHESSRAGLGQHLSAAVAKSPNLFSQEALRFSDRRLLPVYIYHLFRGFQDGLKANATLGWGSILSLATTITERAKTGDLPRFSATEADSSWETDWDGVFQELGAFIEAGLQNTSVGIEFARRREVWQIIESLCEYPDPSLENEKKPGGDKSDFASLSLNTVHGRAFRALFAYIFWCDRHLSSKGEEGSRVPRETKRVLELRLDPAHDAGLTVRSVYGQYFQWLYAYDPPWATLLVDRLFPLDDMQRRYAAWETFLANGMYSPLYKALQPQYEKAISEVRNFKPDRRYWADPVEGLAAHLMVAYMYREEDDRSAIWLKFFRTASPKQRGKAVSFAGQQFVQREAGRSGETLPDTNRAQEFWEWRLKESKDVEELKEFGWWVMVGKFNDEWMLSRLIETLEKTGGDVAMDFQVLSALLASAPQHPLSCAKALSLMVHSRTVDRLMLGHNEDLPRILSALYAAGNAEAIRIAEKMIDHLTKLGFEAYRTIPQTVHKSIETQDKKVSV